MKRRPAASRLAAAALAVAASVALALSAAAAAEPPAAAAGPPERLLLVALDAVPYSTVAELTDPGLGSEALFQGFAGPVELISTFPSTTNIAMAGLLAPFGCEPSPGYEVRFFDHERKRLLGGGPISYHQNVFPWRQLFDWQKPGLISGMVGKLVPIRSTEKEIAAALREFERSDAPVFLIYIANTDAVAHLESPTGLRPIFVALDRELRQLHERQGGERFRTVLFSDHGIAGGEPLTNAREAVHERLRAAGFRVGGRLRGRRDAVIADLGMVSNFEIHTWPGWEGRVADVVAGVPGVELCAYRTGSDAGDGWEIVSAEGSAWFGRRQGEDSDSWAYRPRSGDPLRYAAVVERLVAEAARSERHGRSGRSGVAGEGDWFDGEAWFAATVDHRFPDALHRLAQSFELVANPASLTCSVSPGYMWAARRTALAARLSIGRLRWTHGALDREPSLGFLMSDMPGWRPAEAVRFDRALIPFARAAAAIEAQAGSADEVHPTALARRDR